MIAQRAAVEGEGLPPTTCAADLFTRIEALRAGNAPHRMFPVRWYLGFTTPEPDFLKLRADSWLANIALRWQGTETDTRWVWWARNLLVATLAYTVWALGYWADMLAFAKIGPPGCVNPAIKEIKADIAAKELIGKIIGSDVSYSTQIDQYARNFLCPTETLNFGEAIQVYMAAEMTQAGLIDYGKLNNRCDVATVAIAQSQQGRLSEQDLLELLHRDWLSEDTFRDEMRRKGWLSETYVTWQIMLSHWVPDVSQGVDWARRRITDDAWANRAGLDDEFEAFWAGENKRYLQWRGVEEQEGKRLLRSAYQMVDVSTAADLFRRSLAGMLAPGARFDLQDYRRALEQSTIPPAYRAAYEALLFQPLGFRQLRTLFDENILEANDVARYLIAGGFAPHDAQLLVAEWVKLKPAYFRHKIGAGSAAAYGKAFAAGLMGTAELASELKLEGFTPAEVNAAIAEARAERLRLHRQELIKYLKARYLKGEINETKVQAVLASVGLDAEDIGDLLRFWRVEFEVHPRQASVADLATWYKQGSLSKAEFADSLAQLRYSPADSARIIAAADYDQAAENLKTAEKLVATTAKGLSADNKAWRDLLKQVEKLHGQVEQRILTDPGKLLQWVQKRVLKAPKPISERMPEGMTADDLAAVNGAATDEFFNPEGTSPPTS